MKTRSPKECKTNQQICELSRDNFSTSESWILVSESDVYIANQINGEKSTGNVTLSRQEFDRMISFYLRKQKINISKP